MNRITRHNAHKRKYYRHLLRKLTSDNRKRTLYKGLYKSLSQNVNREAYEALVNKHLKIYKKTNSTPGSTQKYLDLIFWMNQKLFLAMHLSLHDSPPLKILDIGSGAGHFLFVVKYLGHDATGLDLGETDIFNDFIKLLNVPRMEERIEASTPVNGTGDRFNLITSFNTCFDVKKDGSPWDVEEWSYFIDDLFKNHLLDNGCLYLFLNSNKQDDFYSAELKKFFEDRKANFSFGGQGVALTQNTQ